MTIEQKISAIIEDCCAIDPSLHDREAELRPIVRRLIESQPDTKFDAAFAKRLRQTVLAQAAEGGIRRSSLFDRIRDRLRETRRQDVFVLGGAALGLVLAVSLTVRSVGLQMRGDVTDGTAIGLAPQGGTGIRVLADAAFGSLATVSLPPSPSSDAAVSESGTLGLTAESAPAGAPAAVVATRPQSGGGAKMIAPVEPYPAPVSFRFVYKGELGALEAKTPVYRRVKGFPRDGATAAVLGRVTGGMLDLAKLENASVQNFNIVEDREFGYSVFVDANEGTVSFGQHWPKWPHPGNECGNDEECYRRAASTPDRLPSDEAIIAAADRFLSDYGISRDGFGTPEVRHEWKLQYANASPEDFRPIPDSIPVVYAAVLDGLTLHDESGSTTGIVVNVNLRHMRVDNVWGLTSNVFERSYYDAETDAARLIAAAQNGGLFGGWSDPSAKVVEIELGAPETVLTRTWKYNADGTSVELLVPSLRFPVLNPPPEDPWFRRAVIVPLAKELLDASAPVPMPLPAVMTK